MEERSHDEDMGMPSSNTLGYTQHNGRQPSSPPNLSNSPLVLNVRELRDQNTAALTPNLDGQDVYPPRDQINLHEQLQGSRRDPNQNQLPSAAISRNSGASSMQIAGGSSYTIIHRECLRNHAASLGTHVLDGCGEFMPGGEEGSPEALKCAACDCHRNFHRKEIHGESQLAANCCYTHKTNRNTSRRDLTAAPQLPAAIQTHTSLHQHHRYSHGLLPSPSMRPVVPMMMTFGGNTGAPTGSSSEDPNMYQSSGGVQPSGQPVLTKKRVRTKFNQEQKDKMMEFCEKIGWKIQRQNEEHVQQFCSQIGVRRQVFKVWMHNNKQAMKRATVRPNS